MMTEISLNILDVAENSTRAKAKVVQITVDIDEAKDLLTVIIKDDGCGMSEEQLLNKLKQIKEETFFYSV